ncbi:MAG: GNAT family N-acetyltransferase [Candidatus Aenigmarchaeota archaeon]|nr:GNAT family N-acetyltransferase [Candidatus Aenigmarchaeota archaeon]
MQIRIVNDIDKEQWDNLLNSSNHVTIFQTKEMLDLIGDVLYIIAIENDKIICGMPIIKKKKPFLQYISPPWGSIIGDEKAIPEILNKFGSLKASHLSFADYFNKCVFLEKNGFKVKKGFVHIVKLEKQFDNMFKGKISKSRKKNASVALKRGVILEQIKNLEQVYEYYKMAQYTYKLHGRKLAYSFNFFRKIFENMPHLIKWDVAKKNNKIIAGTLHLIYKDMIFDLLDASYRKYQNLRANDLLIYSTMKWGCENGYKYYNFGSSRASAINLMKFKEIWGGEKYYYNIYERSSPFFKYSKKILNIIQKLYIK